MKLWGFVIYTGLLACMACVIMNIVSGNISAIIGWSTAIVLYIPQLMEYMKERKELNDLYRD